MLYSTLPLFPAVKLCCPYAHTAIFIPSIVQVQAVDSGRKLEALKLH